MELTAAELARVYGRWADRTPADVAALFAGFPGRRRESPRDALLPGSAQVWLRRGAADPWEYDVLLSAGTAEEGVYRRDARVRRPWDETLWERDGICYLQPEVQLLHKAKSVRPKDQCDFEATLPHLNPRRRRWLAHALDLTLPRHPWLSCL